jgi:hypothetical protein
MPSKDKGHSSITSSDQELVLDRSSGINSPG